MDGSGEKEIEGMKKIRASPERERGRMADRAMVGCVDGISDGGATIG